VLTSQWPCGSLFTVSTTYFFPVIEQIFVAIVFIGILTTLVISRQRTEIVLMSALGLFVITGVLTVQQAFAGFVHPAVISIASLLIIAGAIEENGGLQFLQRLLVSKKTPSVRRLNLRVMSMAAALSAVLNNTPVVAMFIPVVNKWCEQHGITPSKALIPLSYASIAGGVMTAIGTSTTIIVFEMYRQYTGENIGFFAIGAVGLPVVVVLLVFFWFFASRLLPSRKRPKQAFRSGLDTFLFDLQIPQGSPLAGQQLQQAGLRKLVNVYLVHVNRTGQLVQAAPDRLLHEGDILSFSGAPEHIQTLCTRFGLHPVKQMKTNQNLPWFEAIVAPHSPLVGKTVVDAKFRTTYQGVVLGVFRQGSIVRKMLSELVIQPADVLLIEASQRFFDRWYARREIFSLIAPFGASQGTASEKKRLWLPATLFAGVIIAAAFAVTDIATAAFLGALACVLGGAVSLATTRKRLDFSLLSTIGASLGCAQAFGASGLQEVFATSLSSVANACGPFAIVVLFYLVTLVLTELITNNAAAAFSMAVAMSVAQSTTIQLLPLSIAIAVAASASFITPLGYQTNLMVLGPGGYRFKDFLKVGIPTSILVSSVALTMLWLLFF